MTDNLFDFHSHILPLVDHGSDSIETTLFQLALAKESGVGKIIATSHFYPHLHTVPLYLDKRNKAYKTLVESGMDIPEIKLGAEVLLCENLHKLDSISDLCIYGTKYILIELPFTPLNHGLVHAVKRLVEYGYDVILAHADRYAPDKIETLLEYGVSLQLNADSLAGIFKNKKLFEWIKCGYVVALGSDIHGRDKSAYKKLLKAIKKIGEDYEIIAETTGQIWEKALQF